MDADGVDEVAGFARAGFAGSFRGLCRCGVSWGSDGGCRVMAAAIMACDRTVGACDACLAAGDLLHVTRLGRVSLPVVRMSGVAPSDVVRVAGAMWRMRLSGLPPDEWPGCGVADPVLNPLMVVDPTVPVVGMAGDGVVSDPVSAVGRCADGMERLADAWGAVPSGRDWDEAGRVASLDMSGVDAGAWASKLPGVSAAADAGVRRALLCVFFALSTVAGRGPFSPDAVRAAVSCVRGLPGMPVGFASQELMMLGRVVAGGRMRCPPYPLYCVRVLTDVGLSASGSVVGPVRGVDDGVWVRSASDLAGRIGYAAGPVPGSWLPSWSPLLGEMTSGPGGGHPVAAMTLRMPACGGSTGPSAVAGCSPGSSCP